MDFQIAEGNTLTPLQGLGAKGCSVISNPNALTPVIGI